MNRNIFTRRDSRYSLSEDNSSSSESDYSSSESSFNSSSSSEGNVQQTRNHRTDKKRRSRKKKYNPDVLAKFKDMTRIDEQGQVLRKNKKYNFTNAPYKTIIKDKKLKKVKDAKDFEIMIGSKPSKEEIDKQVSVKHNERENSDDERKVTFSSEKFSKHKKFFDQRNREIFRVNYSNDDHYDLKGDTFKFLEKQQKLLEEGKKTQDEIFQFLAGKK